jgi:hypothetical protein
LDKFFGSQAAFGTRTNFRLTAGYQKARTSFPAEGATGRIFTVIKQKPGYIFDILQPKIVKTNSAPSKNTVLIL